MKAGKGAAYQAIQRRIASYGDAAIDNQEGYVRPRGYQWRRFVVYGKNRRKL